jgi:sec-independent protein translocase protein TatB
MFDVSFPELLVIFVVALVVLGPTRLPGLVSKVGRWVGKARTMARQFREQLETEVNLEELNRMTEAQTKSAKTPPPPPGFNGEPMPAETPTPWAASPEPGVSDPNEDSFSHAHAADAPPMADVFPADPEAPAPTGTTMALDLDLTPAPGSDERKA